ncbi:MAG: hypothetical protein AAF587_34195 [Bacteroidota bacterium]
MNYANTNIQQLYGDSHSPSTRLSKFWQDHYHPAKMVSSPLESSTSLTIWSLSRRQSFPRFRKAMMMLVAIAGIHTGAQTQPLLSEGGQLSSQPWKIGKSSFIHFTGLIRDHETQHPLDQASLVLMSGEDFLAGTFADSDGKFLLQVPTRDLQSDFLTLKIQYLNHVFIRERIDPCSQDLTIDLNRAVWLKTIEVEADTPFEASLSLKLSPHLNQGIA